MVVYRCLTRHLDCAMNRLQFGFYSVLARLDVEVDYAEVERLFLVEAGLVDG